MCRGRKRTKGSGDVKAGLRNPVLWPVLCGCAHRGCRFAVTCRVNVHVSRYVRLWIGQEGRDTPSREVMEAGSLGYKYVAGEG